jgi:transposase
MAIKLTRQTRNQITARRLEGVRLLQGGGINQKEIARRLGVSRQAVSQWNEMLEKHGVEALLPHKHRGTSRLKPAQKQALLEKLEAGALAAGFPTPGWTFDRVQQVIERDFGVYYDPAHVNRLLNAWGWDARRRKNTRGKRLARFIRTK